MIVSSTIISDARQQDGRRWVHERHVDHVGLEIDVTWLCDQDADTAVALTARVPHLDRALRETEIANNLSQVVTMGALAVYTFTYSTPAQNMAALRETYRTATQVEAIMIGDALSARTDAHLPAAFHMTQLQ